MEGLLVLLFILAVSVYFVNNNRNAAVKREDKQLYKEEVKRLHKAAVRKLEQEENGGN